VVELEERLLARLSALDGLAVAVSGGVDSCVLWHAALRALGGRALGVIADSPSLPRAELAATRALAAALPAELVVVSTSELEDPRYRANAGDRCYWCKSALFDALELVAARHELDAMAYGEIADDALDDRPGARAAMERGVLAPLAEVGMTKADVRAYARAHALPVADKPASACLASRLPVGRTVSAGRLERIEQAELRVRALVGEGTLRVRDHGERARIEVDPTRVPSLHAHAHELRASLSELGFHELQLAAYQSPTKR